MILSKAANRLPDDFKANHQEMICRKCYRQSSNFLISDWLARQQFKTQN
jgi:hypothetical protein